MSLNVPPPNVDEVSAPYEFNASQNDAFGDLAMKMRFVGMMGIAAGVLVGIGGIAGLVTGKGAMGWGSLVQATLSLLVGAWTRSAAAGFQRVVDTQGSDIKNLMIAIDELRRIYGLQKLLFIVVIGLLVLAIPLAILFGPGL